MHTAKELRELAEQIELGNALAKDDAVAALRAYAALLASVEDEDGIVRELTGILYETIDGLRVTSPAKVLAAFVAQRQEIESVKGDLKAEERGQENLRRMLVELKAHAEAMHAELEMLVAYLARLGRAPVIPSAAAVTYRAAHPKGAP